MRHLKEKQVTPMVKPQRDNRVIANGPSQSMVKDPQVLSKILKASHHVIRPSRLENERKSNARSK
jgi:hypothetical protein